MDMASKDYINFVMNKPLLKDCPHTFTFHEVCFITVVDWDMHKNNEPRCLLPVNPFKFFSEPFPLRGIFHCSKVQINFEI